MRQGFPRKLVVAIALVLAVAASLWFASPARALTIDTTPPPDGIIGDTHPFTVVVTIEDAELLPIQSINLYIYKSDDRTTYEAVCVNLPLADGPRYYPGSETGGGDVDIVADADSAWGYGYGYRYVHGDEATGGWGYYYFGYGYGYGFGPTSITYTGTWNSPSTWPAGTYEIEVEITADGKTFAKTSDTFILSRPAPPTPRRGAGAGGGGADTRAPVISDVCTCPDVAVTRTTADICWTTDEISDSQVIYDTESPLASMLSPLDKTLVYEHHVQLTGLTPATTYYYKTMSRDFNDNLAVSDEYTFTTLGVPAAFTISDLSISPAEVDIGEEVTISVLVTNTGEFTSVYEVTLKIDNVVVDTEEITLAGGATQEVAFVATEDAAGTYTINVNGLIGTFVVGEAPPSPPPSEPPVTPTAGAINWWIIGGIIAAVVALVVNLVRIYRRRRA